VNGKVARDYTAEGAAGVGDLAEERVAVGDCDGAEK
jgi:hypothetical protein